MKSKLLIGCVLAALVLGSVLYMSSLPDSGTSSSELENVDNSSGDNDKPMDNSGDGDPDSKGSSIESETPDGHADIPASDERPEEVPANDFEALYPVGRQLSSVGITTISGNGEDKQWGISGSCQFKHFFQVKSKTKVLENENDRIKFLVEFEESVQNTVVSDVEFELDLPEMPLVDLIVHNAQKLPLLTNMKLAGVIIKGGTQVIEQLDPGLKKTVTWIADLLEIAPGSNVEIQNHVEKISGKSFEIDYVNGLGPVSIKEVGLEKTFTDSELIAIANQSALLMDYFLVPVNAKEGDQWNVNPRDIARLINFGKDASVSGEVALERGASIDEGGEQIATLTSPRSTIYVQGESDTEDESAKLSVKSALIKYSDNDRVTRSSKIIFDAATMFRSKNHLLFETKKLRNLAIEARYEAEVVK